MSTDWLGDAGTAVVGLAGIGATLWAQRTERVSTRRLQLDDRARELRKTTYERLILQAIEVSEFVAGADVIFVRDAVPPDVDTNSYDAWMVLDLYASPAFAFQYRTWQKRVATARDILDEVPEKRVWYRAKGDIPERFRAATAEMETALERVIETARGELNPQSKARKGVWVKVKASGANSSRLSS
ncbi:hypothetical protein [Curtobacterium sp. MCLR17_043]|uniref:hypothetical protein n=1 Tax=Curtobacterium sp. MCLR17_043 TaxID=2175627 RepID=UPI0011B69CC4|nr:hypothetical protein [Curtobacterium sp. MCLR17_043]